LVPETKANDDDAHLLVDEMNKSSADDLGEKSVILYKSTSCKILLESNC
jgi:hypothetical protein